MARVETDPNYTTPTFSRATAATDIFKKEDVQGVAAALSTHEHGVGKGLPVTRLGTLNQNITFSNNGARFEADAPTFVPYSSNTNLTLALVPTGTGIFSQINLYATSVVAGTQYAAISSQTSGLLLMANRTGAAAFGGIHFYTSDLSRMVINAGGQVSMSVSLAVSGNISATGDVAAGANIGVGTGTSATIYLGTDAQSFITRSGTAVAMVVSAGGVFNVNVAGGAWGPLSSGQHSVFGNIHMEVNGNMLYGRSNTNALAPLIGTSTDNYVALYCGPAGLLFTNSSNTVRIGTMGNNGTLNINSGLSINDARGVNQGVISIHSSGAASNDSQILAESGLLYFWLSHPTAQVYVQAQGGGTWKPINASAFTVNSTVKSKSKLVPLAASDALAKVVDERVTPISFDLNGNPGRHLGFTAEDMQHVVPEVGTRDRVGELEGINYHALVPVLWGAVRELSARLKALEAA
jgi:hypothetical protein